MKVDTKQLGENESPLGDAIENAYRLSQAAFWTFLGKEGMEEAVEACKRLEEVCEAAALCVDTDYAVDMAKVLSKAAKDAIERLKGHDEALAQTASEAFRIVAEQADAFVGSPEKEPAEVIEPEQPAETQEEIAKRLRKMLFGKCVVVTTR